MASTNVWLCKGFSHLDLIKGVNGSHVQDEEPCYPKLRIEVSKVSPRFGWLPKEIKLGVYSQARKSPTEWFIRAVISAHKEDSGLFEFAGTYSTNTRIGAGNIITRWLDENNYPLDSLSSDFLDIYRNPKSESERNVLVLAYRFYSVLSVLDDPGERAEIKKMSGKILNMTSDYRVQYLLRAVIKKIDQGIKR